LEARYADGRAAAGRHAAELFRLSAGVEIVNVANTPAEFATFLDADTRQ
jgi:hypothetical protein